MNLRKKKERIFLYHLLCPKEFFFNIIVLSQCKVYQIHFQNNHTFTYQKILLYALLLFVLKLSKVFSVSLICSGHYFQLETCSVLKPYHFRSFFMLSLHNLLDRSFFPFPSCLKLHNLIFGN